MAGGTLQLASTVTVDLPASILFIREHKDRVYVGLEDGKMAVFNRSTGGCLSVCLSVSLEK